MVKRDVLNSLTIANQQTSRRNRNSNSVVVTSTIYSFSFRQ